MQFLLVYIIYECMTTKAINTDINSMLHFLIYDDYRLMEWLVKSFYFDSNNKGTGTQDDPVPVYKEASLGINYGWT